MGSCFYCNEEGPKRIGIEEGSSEDLYCCNMCWELLKNPVTALQLLRGHVSLELRGILSKETAEPMIEEFINRLSDLKPSTKN